VKRVIYIFLTALLCSSVVLGQNKADSLPFEIYKDKIVLHSSIGLNDAPFRLKGQFQNQEVLRYRSNLNPIIGMGIAYKWFALNLNFKLPGHLRNTDDYGKSNYFDLGVKFGLKRWFFKIDLHGYNGFGIKNASQINDTLPVSQKDIFYNNKIQSLSLSFNVYRFSNTNFKMKPAFGVVGKYHEETQSFYLKYTVNAHGISASNGIMPYNYFNHSASVYEANSISAFDFGAVPGFAYVHNQNGWQYSFLAGVGAVIQAKVFSFQGMSRSFLGLAPRIDLKAQAGYNVEDWFLMFTSSFDNKSIRVSEIRYRQIYYYLRLTYGYRF
jgi:hypothetical protein